MSDRALPLREQIFVRSLIRHGFRYSRQKQSTFKINTSYVIPATKREDAEGIDFWIKPRGIDRLIPVQVTQRGVSLYRKYNRRGAQSEYGSYDESSKERLRAKRARCRENRIAFVLIRDFDGAKLNTCIAWGDVKALRYAMARM